MAPAPLSRNTGAPDLFCPSCGSVAYYLDEVTGWCADCSLTSFVAVAGGASGASATGATGLSVNGGIVMSKMELALRANAERVEFYVSTTNTSVWQALKLAQQDGPTCIVCGNPMPHASRQSLICRKTPECRRYSRRYVYRYREKGMTKTEALASILRELTGE